MRRIVVLFLLILMLVSCSPDKKAEGVSFTDDLGRQVTLTLEDKVAACHASFADCWLLSGGQLTAVTSDAVEDHGLDVGNAHIIGTAKTVNTEALTASGATVALLSADLTAHLELEQTLTDLGIKCIYFRVDDFEDYSRVMERLCSVTGRDDLYTENVTDVGKRIEDMLSRIPSDEQRSVLLMRAYSSGIKAKSDDNLAGLILKEYGLKNLADSSPSMLEDMSLEHIVETDPDVIFVMTMGNEEAALGYLEDNIENNPAFKELSAVKNGNYYILPKDLFHYKPNERWDESYEYLAQKLYPQIFG